MLPPTYQLYSWDSHRENNEKIAAFACGYVSGFITPHIKLGGFLIDHVDIFKEGRKKFDVDINTYARMYSSVTDNTQDVINGMWCKMNNIDFYYNDPAQHAAYVNGRNMITPIFYTHIHDIIKINIGGLYGSYLHGMYFELPDEITNRAEYAMNHIGLHMQRLCNIAAI